MGKDNGLVRIVSYENLMPCQVFSLDNEMHKYFREMTAEFKHDSLLFNVVHHNTEENSRILLGVVGNGNIKNFTRSLEYASKLMSGFIGKFPLAYGGSSRGMVETRPFVLDDVLSREDVICLLAKYQAHFDDVRVKDIKYENIPKELSVLPGCVASAISYKL